MVTIGADVRQAYESEAGRLTTSVATLDGHIGLLRADVVGLRGKVSGCVSTIETLTRGLVLSVEQTKASLDKQFESMGEGAESRQEFCQFLKEQMRLLQEKADNLVTVHHQVLIDIEC